MVNLKQQNLFGVTLLKSSDKTIRRMKRELPEAELHGHKFWKSSALIMDYLQQRPKHTRKVLEIGCGWGLLGIYCAKHHRSKVTAVDADKNVFPYLNLHADLNQVKVQTTQSRFEKLTRAFLGQHDLVVGADICFWEPITNILFNLIKRSLAGGVKRIIIADPGRPPFYDLCTLCEKKLNARTVPHTISQPFKASGYLLEINLTQSNRIGRMRTTH